MPVIHAKLVKTLFVGLEPKLKISEVARGDRRPRHFGQRRQTRKGHVFDLLQIRNVFRPNIALSTQNMFLEFRRKIRGKRLEGIDFFQR